MFCVVKSDPFSVAHLSPTTRTSLPLDVATREENTPAVVKAQKVAKLMTSGSETDLSMANGTTPRQVQDILDSLHSAAVLVSEFRSISCCWWYNALWGAFLLIFWWIENETIAQKHVPVKVT